jgi:hypothetical protein
MGRGLGDERGEINMERKRRDVQELAARKGVDGCGQESLK